jgi:glycerol-3-phosphate dehydrogenase
MVLVGLALGAVASAAVYVFAGAGERAPVGEGGEAVSVEAMKTGGTGSSEVMAGQTAGTETLRCRYVVNCAGGGSDKVARMVGDDSFTIKPRLGEYREGALAAGGAGVAC